MQRRDAIKIKPKASVAYMLIFATEPLKEFCYIFERNMQDI
ncbi:hypothetical protein [Bacillus sp. AFS023182]|nr:hypothetical protein [Bacillus sp. AFS023182]